MVLSFVLELFRIINGRSSLKNGVLQEDFGRCIEPKNQANYLRKIPEIILIIFCTGNRIEKTFLFLWQSYYYFGKTYHIKSELVYRFEYEEN